MTPPTVSLTRDSSPDVLRGFALWGIIVVNVAYFSTSVSSGVTGDSIEGSGDAVAAFLVQALASGKFYILFSFLFGYSAHYLLKDPVRGRRRWVARNVGLIVLGLLHASLLFIGDILFLYGLLGLALTFFLARSDRVITAWAAGIYGVTVVVLSGLAVLTWWAQSAGFASEELQAGDYEQAVRAGTYLGSIAPRVELWLGDALFLIFFQGSLTFVAFLVGVLASRINFLGSGRPEGAAKRLMVWGLGVGLPLQLGTAAVWVGNEVAPSYSETLSLVSFFASFVTAPLLSAGYVGVLLWVGNVAPRALALLGYAGRMSLTVYLSQSLALSLIFGAWGLGLYQEIPYWAAVLLAVGVALGLTLGAAAWLSFFRQGPMERLLSSWSSLFRGSRGAAKRGA